MRKILTLSYSCILVITIILSSFSGCTCGDTPELPDVPAVSVSDADLSPTDTVVTPTDVVEEEPAEPFVTLVRGDKGDRVAEVQTRLIELGFLDDVADGSYGGRTKRAVDAFQEAAGLPVSGEIDEGTFTVLMSENAPAANSDAKTTTTATSTTTTKKKTDSTSSKKTTTTEKKETTTKKTTTTQKKTTTTEKKDTTTKKTTTTTKATTTTTTTTATKKTTTTTTTTKASRWVSKSAMEDVKSTLKSYAGSIGMGWDSSLDADTATWGSNTRAYTTGYSKSEYVSRMKSIIQRFYNNYGYEYVNIKITAHTNGEYLMTCYFG